MSEPTLLSPAHGEDVDETAVLFEWKEVEDAQAYHLQVARDPNFEDVMHDERLGDVNSHTYSGLPSQEGYALYWRVKPIYAGGEEGEYSQPAGFAVTSTTHPAQVEAAKSPTELEQSSYYVWMFIMATVVLSVVLMFWIGYQYANVW